MARTTPGRRSVAFGRVEEILPDLDRLARSHRTVGRWSLAQICHHLAFAFDASVDGFPTPPFPWVLRATLGRLALRQMLTTGRIPEGVWLPRKLKPAPELDTATELESLNRAINRFLKTPVPGAVHPFFGTLAPDQWHVYHRVHSAHHLSFAVPEAS